MIEEGNISTTEDSNDQSSELARVAQASPFQSLNRNELEGAGDGPFAKLSAPEGVRGLFKISFADLEVILNCPFLPKFSLLNSEISKMASKLGSPSLLVCTIQTRRLGPLPRMALLVSRLSLTFGPRTVPRLGIWAQFCVE